MPWAYKLSSLCFYYHTIKDVVSEELIKNEISRGFSEYRCFPFMPDRNVINQLR